MTQYGFDKETGALPAMGPDIKEPDTATTGFEEPESDETTGASPGTAQACDDLGLNSLEANLSKFGIKPPGVA